MLTGPALEAIKSAAGGAAELIEDGIASEAESMLPVGRLGSPIEVAPGTKGYTYDAASNLTQVTYPGGKTVSCTYDALSWISIVLIDWLPEVTRLDT